MNSQTIDPETIRKVREVAAKRASHLWKPFGVERAAIPPSEQDLRQMRHTLTDPNAVEKLEDAQVNLLLADLDHAREEGTVPEDLDRAVVAASERVIAYLCERRESPAELEENMPDDVCEEIQQRLVSQLLAAVKYVGGIFVPAAIRLRWYDLAMRAVKELVLLLTSERFRKVPGGGAEGYVDVSNEQGEREMRHILLYPVLDRLAFAFATLENQHRDPPSKF